MNHAFDPGLTERFSGKLRRIVNKDGSFNVKRLGGGTHLYLYLIEVSWPLFFALAVMGYLTTNCIFASLYYLLGIENLQGGDPAMPPILNAFFFSTQTLTTVGYGHISPRGIGTSLLAAFEGMLGVMGFAVLTGLLYGRVSRPSSRIVFSRAMVVAPYEGGWGLQFRVANWRRNVLMDIGANMVLMTVQNDGGQLKRRYAELTLERSRVFFIPLTWTVVHPINESSPLWGKTRQDLAAEQAEVIILIRAFDDTFSQTVHARHSYRHEEIEWGARFEPAFYFDLKGDMVLELAKLDDFSRLEPEAVPAMQPPGKTSA